MFRGRRSQDGAAAVELALVLPLLVLFVFGTIEFGLAYNRQQAFQAAAREAGRLAAVGYHDEVNDPSSTVNERVRRTAASTVSPSHVRVQTEACSGDPDPEFITAVVELVDDPAIRSQYQIRIPLVPGTDSVSFRSEAVFRCEVRSDS